MKKVVIKKIDENSTGVMNVFVNSKLRVLTQQEFHDEEKVEEHARVFNE